MEGTFLAVVDADRIQDYIFAPRQLKLIRGASAIQRDLNLKYSLESLRHGKYGPGNVEGNNDISPRGLDGNPEQKWEVVYAGGGNLYALFWDERAAKDAVSTICALYRKHGATASAAGAVVPWTDSFPNTLERAQADVMQRKTAPSTPANPISSPYWKSCEACGLAPAARWTRNPVTGERILCEACEVRRENSEHAPLLAKINSDLKPPKDFEEIAKAARPENYLAMVYLDVDKLGRYFQRFEPLALTPDVYRKQSLHIRYTVENSVIAGCQAACRGVTAGSPAPFEILMLGGDDAIIMLAAQFVFPFLDEFKKTFQNGLGTSLSFSAGVVWAHHHLPVAQYAYHTRKLQRSAKKDGGNRLDYMIASESMARARDADADARTLRPYTFEEFSDLHRTILAWKKAGFPANKARQLYPLAFEEESQGTLDFLYWLSRLEEQHRAAASKFFEHGFWRRQPRRATGAADLAELWDFVEAV